jgi:iron complex outermembrane receptor protein
MKTLGNLDISKFKKKDLTRVPTRRIGVYVQDLISLTEKLKFLAGVRWSYLENKNTSNQLSYF